MSLKERSYKKELLDEDDIPFEDILVNLEELNTVNTLLGGHKATCRGVDFFLNKIQCKEPITIAEIGCGGGDNLLAIERFLKKKNQLVHFIGIDIKGDCISYASQHAPANSIWICSDYRK